MHLPFSLDSRPFRGLTLTVCVSLGLCSCGDQPPPQAKPELSVSPATTGAAGSGAASLVAPLSGYIPVVIPPHDTTLSPTNSRPFFDVFSWESFIALNWPAQPGRPGVPNQPATPSVFTGAANGSPVVWMSYKTIDDLFSTGSQRPLPWGVGPTTSTSLQGVKANLPILARFTKSKNADQLTDTKEAFSFPLVDQNKAYTRYEVRYNQPFYDFVRGQDSNPASWLYLAANLAPKEPVTLPPAVQTTDPATSVAGAIMLKASWREMTDADVQGQRYYIISAMVQNIDGKTFTEKKMGLVGFHIAQKLPNFKEWIWSSFEQVDNVKRGVGSTATTPISYNNGTDNPATTGGWADRPKTPHPVPNPTPAQVTRFNPIPTTPAGQSTVDINAAYQQALKGTVWQNYELVITQWPSDPTTFATMEAGGVYPTSSGGAFPVNGCVNTTMETFLQAPNDAVGGGGNSCMSCHYQAGQADYSWGLMRRAH